MKDDIDPMLTRRSGEYAAKLMEKVDALVEEDRQTRRTDLKKSIENPPLMIGSVGFGDGSKAG